MKSKISRFSLLGLAVLSLLSCQSAPDAAAPHILQAIKVSSAPDVKSGATDPIWSKARALDITLFDGANFGAKAGETADTKATLKAVYTNDMLYMLIQYADPTYSIQRTPYQKQTDGSWKLLKDPNDKGGDDNVYYEDKWAMLWVINNSIKKFDQEGCAALCHLGEGKPYGNKYTAKEGEIADIWHMKGQRTAPWGFADDQYVDHTRFDPKISPNAGRKNEPGIKEYESFPLVNGKPQFMARGGTAANSKGYASGTYYIKRGDEVAFDDTLFKAGDEVASFIINELNGDRSDVRAITTWHQGTYTSVVSRKLVTNSRFDVQFSNLDERYGFGFAAFDNAQVRHATSDDPLYLVFGK